MTIEKQEQGDQTANAPPEKQAIQTADAQGARNAAASDVKAVLALNQDAHSGSAGGDQLESIQIIALDERGKQKVVAERPKEAKKEPAITTDFLRERAKQPDIWAQKFVDQIEKAEKLPAPYRDGYLAKILKEAEAVYRPKGATHKAGNDPNLMDTGTMLAVESQTNPAAEPVKLLKEWVEKQLESPQKQAFRQEVRQQAADLSPEMQARMEHLATVRRKIDVAGLEEGGVHEAIRPDQLVLQGHVEHKENPWQAFNNLSPDQQRDIVKAFEAAGAVGQNAYEEQIEAVSESIPKGFYNVGKGLLDIGVAAATFVLESVKEPDKVPKATKELAEHLSQAITSGVDLSKFAAGQAQDMAKTGDYSPAIRAIGFVVETANERWQAMPLEQQTEKGSELVAEMGVGALIGAWHKLAKSGKLIDALEEIAEHLKELTAPGRDKAKRAMANFIDDVLQPRGLVAQPVAEGSGIRLTDTVQEAQEKGFKDHIMEMVRYFEDGNKSPISAEKAAEKAKVSKQDLRRMTESELEAHGLESIQKSYDRLFFSKYPHLKDTGVVVHHALPQMLLDKRTGYSGLFKAREVNSIEYLRGVPLDAMQDGKWVHDIITARWRTFLPHGRKVTRQQVLDELRAIDKEFGQYFVPPMK